MALEKKLPATRKKLEEARNRGDVAKSRSLSGIVGVSVSFFTLIFARSGYTRFCQLSREIFSLQEDFQTNNMLVSLPRVAVVLFTLTFFALAAGFIGVLLAEIAQVGLSFSLQPLKPSLKRLSLGNGMKRLFGVQEEGVNGAPAILVELVRLLVCLLVLVACTGGLILSALESFPQSPHEVLGVFLSTVPPAAGTLLLLGVGLAVIELLHQRKQRAARLQMDIEEFKRELRENEGNPELRGMRKQLHFDLLRQRALLAVRKAQAILVGNRPSNSASEQ